MGCERAGRGSGGHRRKPAAGSTPVRPGRARPSLASAAKRGRHFWTRRAEGGPGPGRPIEQPGLGAPHLQREKQSVWVTWCGKEDPPPNKPEGVESAQNVLTDSCEVQFLLGPGLRLREPPAGAGGSWRYWGPVPELLQGELRRSLSALHSHPIHPLAVVTELSLWSQFFRVWWVHLYLFYFGLFSFLLNFIN